MKIALFHHIETGGAKRAVYEHAKGLRNRGHVLHLFTPTKQTDNAFLPLAPLCEKVFTYDDGAAEETSVSTSSSLGGDESRLRQTARGVLGVGLYETLRDTVWVQKQEKVRADLTGVYALMARDIGAGPYDILYAHQCGVTLAPPLLRFVQGRLPVVFYCQDTLRKFSEWPVIDEQNADDYDALPASTFLRRKTRWGRVVSPMLAAFGERENERFVYNLRAASVVLANSLYSRESLQKATGAPIRVCYLGVDADFFCPSEPNAPTENEVLSVGALRPEKRHEFVIASVATIAESLRPRVRIVGYGMDGTGQRFADTLGEQARVQKVSLTIEREVTDEILLAAYRRAGVFAFAPRMEPFGLVILEALACGTPAVAANEGGPREIVQDGKTGLVADASDPRAFGAALVRVLQSESLHAALSRAGRDAITARWTWAQSAQRTETILTEAAADTQ